MIISHTFIDSAKKFGDKIAVVDIATTKDISFSRALVAAFILQKKIAKIKSKNIGLMLPTSAGAIISFIAITFAGKVPVMINYSTQVDKSCKFAQNKCTFKKIITSKKFLEKLGVEPIEGMIFLEDLLLGANLFEKIGALVKSKLPASFLKASMGKCDENDDLVILFTSGSENEPKGVVLTQKNITHQLINIPRIFELSENDSFLANIPVFHVFGITATFLLPFYLGCKIIAHPNPLDYSGICQSIEKNKPTFVVGTPTFFRGYLKKATKNTFKSVKIMVAGAEKLPQKLRKEFKRVHNIELLEGYGVTESSPVVSVNTPENVRHGSIGKPIPNQKLRIVQIKTDEVLPPGEVGKIQVKGDNIMKGYYNDVEQTSLRIHNGWYDTGDMGFVDEDGFVWHKGRLKRFIKIGGEMVSLPAVEQALTEYFGDGDYYCAVELPDEKKGAVVALVATTAINERKIRKYLHNKIAPVAIPKKFFQLEDIPLMGSGKVDFRSVEKICLKLNEQR